MLSLSSSSGGGHGASPVLFNSETKMMDVIDSMHQGCPMIILESDIISDKTLDFQHYSLSKDNKSIECHLNRRFNLRLSDLAGITNCRQSQIDLIHSFLNVSGLDKIGLKPIVFEMSLKKGKAGQSLTVIFDSMTNANVWFYGLDKLYRLKKPSSLKALTLVTGNELEAYVKDDEPTKKAPLKSRFDFHNAAFVETIKYNLDRISQSIKEFESFCNIHCIFGSYHICTLNECQSCIELLKEIKHLIAINDENSQIFFSGTNYDIYHLKENWYKLNCKLTVICLKSLDLRFALAQDSQVSKDSSLKRQAKDDLDQMSSNDGCSSLSITPKDCHDDDPIGNANKVKNKKVSSIYEIFESAIETEHGIVEMKI